MNSIDDVNLRSRGKFPGHLGIRITHIFKSGIQGEMEIQPYHLAPNGFLHAGSMVTFADTVAGFGSFANLPDGATSFTTVELKSSFFGTALQGKSLTVGELIHGGRPTPIKRIVNAFFRRSGVCAIEVAHIAIYRRFYTTHDPVLIRV